VPFSPVCFDGCGFVFCWFSILSLLLWGEKKFEGALAGMVRLTSGLDGRNCLYSSGSA
jgi:hypothetical protein